MNRRDWYAGGVGSAITGAALGAVLGNAGILVFNLACLALNIYLWHTVVKKGEIE